MNHNPPATREQIINAQQRIAQRCYFNALEHELPHDLITQWRILLYRQAYERLSFYESYTTPVMSLIRAKANELGLPWNDCITLTDAITTAIAQHRTVSLDNGATYSCTWHPQHRN